MRTSFGRLLVLVSLVAVTAAVPTTPSGRPVEGSLSVNAEFLAGTTSMLASGTAPAGSSVFISLSATFDPGVPAVVVDRVNLVADKNNRYSAILPYAPASVSIAVLSVEATLEGLAPVTACCFQVPGSPTHSGAAARTTQRLLTL